MHRRLYQIFLLIIIGVAAFFGYKFYQQYQNKEHADHIRISNILHPRQPKTKTVKKANPGPAYNNNDWLIMGYMAYARHNYVQSRGVKDTAQLVQDIEKDLQSGALKAKKEDQKTYILSNKYGSVNAYVKKGEVKITGDGVTVTSKKALKSTFNKYQEQVREMGQMIK